MAVRTAVPCILLIRMRSQVQVLAGPPPIVAGQSAAGSEPGALAAGLGRAGAARPSPPAPSVAPSGSAHPGVRLGDDHPPWSRPQTRTAARLWVQPPRAAARTRAHRAAAREGRSERGLACLVAQWSSGGRRGQHPTRRPGSATDLPLTNATWAASPASRPPRPSLEPSTAQQPQGLHPFRWSRSPGHFDLGPQRHRLRWRIRTRPDRRGQTPDAWTPHGWTADGWTPDGWTADGRAPDALDDHPR